ncbi:MAG TPA: hypothetical protein VFT64_11530 [Rickettsiales bacterium]|nr:hypothetical protein [Rickettsiales bacterium]
MTVISTKYIIHATCILLIALGMTFCLNPSGYALNNGEGEGISNLADLSIPNSSWVIRNRVMGNPSPAGGSGWLDITANNTTTGEHVLILRLSDIQTPLQERYEEPNRLIIQLPNRTDIVEQHNSFANFTAVYKFTPKDNPSDRTAYQFWWRHPREKKAIQWCMHNLGNKDLCNP